MEKMYLVVETNIYYEGKRRAIEQMVLSVEESEEKAIEKIEQRSLEAKLEYDSDGNFMGASANGKGWAVHYSIVEIIKGDVYRDIINMSL